MKTTTLVLGAIAATSACASIYLGLQLGDARDQLARESEARSAAEARLRANDDDWRQHSARVPDARAAAVGLPVPGAPVKAPEQRVVSPPKSDPSLPPPRDRSWNVDNTP